MSKSPVVTPLTAIARQDRAKKMSIEGEKARAEYDASAEATEAKTKRLRAMRLERDDLERAAEKPPDPVKAKKAAAKKPPVKKPIRRNIPL